MPGGYTESVRKWLELAEIDYVGPFVKAWLAFNAWYRSVYTHKTDRAILEEFRWQPNVIRNKLVPLLGQSSEEGEQLRAHIGDLHHRLERYHIHSAHGGGWERVTFTSVFLRTRVPAPVSQSRYGWTHSVTPGGGNHAQLTVIVQRNGTMALTLTQARYDITELQSHADFQRLSANKQGILLAVYRQMNPRIIANLTDHEGPCISCGAYSFRCSHEDLFAGLCEVLYSMRCSLFHGELVPDREAVACYEPAYRIIKRFLSSIA